MTIRHNGLRIDHARFYTPETTKFDGTPLRAPRFEIMFKEDANPDRPELPWRSSSRDPARTRYAVYAATATPRLTFAKPEDYVNLIALHNVFKVRNIPLDLMFRGALCDLIVKEWERNDETVLQFSELIFADMTTFNINGDLPA